MWEVIEPLFANLDMAIVLGIGAGALRSVSGWLDHSLKNDGKIDTFEWKLLSKTMLKYTIAVMFFSLGIEPTQGVALMFGLDMAGNVVAKAKA